MNKIIQIKFQIVDRSNAQSSYNANISDILYIMKIKLNQIYFLFFEPWSCGQNWYSTEYTASKFAMEPCNGKRVVLISYS